MGTVGKEPAPRAGTTWLSVASGNSGESATERRAVVGNNGRFVFLGIPVRLAAGHPSPCAAFGRSHAREFGVPRLEASLVSLPPPGTARNRVGLSHQARTRSRVPSASLVRPRRGGSAAAVAAVCAACDSGGHVVLTSVRVQRAAPGRWARPARRRRGAARR